MNDARTVWVGNLADQVTEELLYELFLQAGPLERVKIPTDREGRQSTFGFITFKHEISVPYTVQLLNGTRLFDKNLNIKPRNTGAPRDKQIGQQNIQRSFSYPNEAQQNQHIRFNEHSDMGAQHVSYEDLVRLGHMLNVNCFSENNLGSDYTNNIGHIWSQNDGNNTYEDRERDLERRNCDRHRNDYDRDRGRRHNYPNSRSRRNDKRNNYDRNSGRRSRRHY